MQANGYTAQTYYLTAVGLALLAAAVAGVLPLLGISPLLAPLGVLALIGLMVLAQVPWLGMFMTVILFLLPNGMIAGSVQSFLGVSTLGISLLLWFLFVLFRGRSITWTTPFVLMLFFMVWGFCSLLWTADFVVGRQEIVQYTLVITLFFLLVNQVNSWRRVDGLMLTLALCGWIMAGAGVWLLLSGGYEAGTRFKIFDMNENMQGVYLIICTPGMIWLTLRATNPQRKRFLMVLSLLYMLLTLVIIALSGSRGNLISFALMILTMGLAKPTRAWAQWGGIAAVVIILAFPTLFTSTVERFLNSGEDELGSRDLLWSAGLLLISERPWTGAGIGNGPYMMIDYVQRVTENDHVYARQQLPAHNPIIEVGTDLGIPGVLLYLAILGSAGWQFLRTWWRAKAPTEQVLTSYCALIGALSVGFLSAWIKNGGADSHFTTFLLFFLWTVPALRASSAPHLAADTRGAIWGRTRAI